MQPGPGLVLGGFWDLPDTFEQHLSHRVPGTGSRARATTRLAPSSVRGSHLCLRSSWQAGQGELCRVLHGVLDLLGLLQPGRAAPLPQAAERLRQLRPGQAGLGAARPGEPVQGESCWPQCWGGSESSLSCLSTPEFVDLILPQSLSHFVLARTVRRGYSKPG